LSTLPRRIDAARKVEAELLGSLMRWPAEIPDVRDRLAADDFHHDAHQRVYRALLRMHDRRQPVDLVGVCEELRTAGEGIESVFVAELWAAAGTGAGHQADRVLGLALERGLAHAAAEILGDVENPTGPIAELLNRAQARLDGLAKRVSGTSSVPLGAVVARLLSEIDARASGRRKCGVPTGFAEFDRTLAGGLPLGCLTVLAARPSVGKTSFAGHVARNVAERGAAVLFVSLEQPELELAERVTSGDARVSGWRMRAGDLFPEHVRRITESAGRTRGSRSTRRRPRRLGRSRPGPGGPSGSWAAWTSWWWTT
jgi:replicative DNA helicase